MADPKSLQIRDKILESMLFSFADNPLFQKEIIFQGGGALHFIYGSPRYSSDLDFVWPALPQLRKELCQSLEEGIIVDSKRIQPLIRQDSPPKFLRATYSLCDSQPAGKLEVYAQDSFDNNSTTGKFAPLRVQTPSEIYADKITASLSRLANRGSLKATDLFDLNYIELTLQGNASLNEIKRKAESYNEENLITDVMWERAISYIENPENHNNFRRQLERTLMPDVFENATFDSIYFHKCADHFRKYVTKLKE